VSVCADLARAREGERHVCRRRELGDPIRAGLIRSIEADYYRPCGAAPAIPRGSPAQHRCGPSAPTRIRWSRSSTGTIAGRPMHVTVPNQPANPILAARTDRIRRT